MRAISEAVDYRSAAAALDLFHARLKRDMAAAAFPEFLRRWLFAERLQERGLRQDMNFFSFDGPKHIEKLFRWIRDFKYNDYFVDPDNTEISIGNDKRVCEHYGLSIPDDNLRAVGRYNAQDFQLQRFYPVPERQALANILDFGAGHGRMANLAFTGKHRDRARCYVAVDAIPSTYLTQNLYYKGLGLNVAEYLDHDNPAATFDFAALAAANDAVHLPTWRMSLLPDDWFDLVCCVQVLKELPASLVPLVIREFARVLKPGAALYVRDHQQFHNPNQMPVDDILAASGFVLEFRPHIVDRRELHGLPRVWRKMDHRTYFDSGNA